MIRALLVGVAIYIAFAGIVLVASAKVKKSGARPADAPPPPRVLMIGDSLSVGPFGEAVQNHLKVKLKTDQVFAYASCGSSPENWLAGEKDFVTKCGYRENTPGHAIFIDFNNGHRPAPTRTPKVESLVGKHTPTIVVVQQGTNWMDRNLSDGEINSYIDRFVRAARGGGQRKLIWITPPDSSKFRGARQNRVQGLLRDAAGRDGFQIINSRTYTHYRPGVTGGDGIHYNSAASTEWADFVNGALDDKLESPVTVKRARIAAGD